MALLASLLFIECLNSLLAMVNGAVQLTINASNSNSFYSVSENIYCINFMYNATFAKEISLPLARIGGNAASRFNYEIECTNRGADWYFENSNWELAKEMQRYQQTNTKVLLTIPANGYVAYNCQPSCGFPKSQGYQSDGYAPDRPDCGNGSLNGNMTYSGPWLTSKSVDAAFVKAMVQNLTSKYGNSIYGWELDNEPDYWHVIHRDAFNTGVTCDGLLNKGKTFGAAVRDANWGANLLGPVSSGWWSAFISSYQLQRKNGTSDCPGQDPLIKYCLGQMCWYPQTRLSHLDMHYYANAEGVLENDTSGSSASVRLESTRSLWDLNYEDPSWLRDIKGQTGNTANVALITRLKSWINDVCSGTKIAITEYSYGGHLHVSGALAQADVLGIFAREGVDVACYWALKGDPISTSHIGQAFRLFRNTTEAEMPYVVVSCQDTENRATLKLKRAVDELQHILNPTKPNGDELKRKQLMELEIINGTYRPPNFNILKNAQQMQQPLSAMLQPPFHGYQIHAAHQTEKRCKIGIHMTHGCAIG